MGFLQLLIEPLPAARCWQTLLLSSALAGPWPPRPAPGFLLLCLSTCPGLGPPSEGLRLAIRNRGWEGDTRICAQEGGAGYCTLSPPLSGALTLLSRVKCDKYPTIKFPLCPDASPLHSCTAGKSRSLSGLVGGGTETWVGEDAIKSPGNGVLCPTRVNNAPLSPVRDEFAERALVSCLFYAFPPWL